MGRPKKEEKEKEAQLTPEDIMTGLLEETQDDHFNDEEEIHYKITSGSLNLDVELGGGYGPGFHRFAGHNNAGKSPSALEVQSNFLRYHIQNNRKAKGIYVRAEGRLSIENMERVGVKYVKDPQQWEDGSVLIINCQKYETIAKYISTLIRNNPTETLFCFIIDSMDGLKVKADEGKQFDEATKVAGSPLLTKRFLTDLSLEVNIKGHMGILISQVVAEIKIDPYSRTPPRDGSFGGGNALSHYVNWAIEFNKFHQGDLILNNSSGKINDGKTKVLGHWCKVRICKSLNEKNYVVVQYPVKHGVKGKSAVWVEYEIVDQLLAWELAKKAGAWIEVSADLIKEAKEKIDIDFVSTHQGIDKFRSYLEENPKLVEFLFNKFRAILANA
jgi:RecA/RadA recombinase